MEEVIEHKHNGIDAPQISGRDLLEAPQTALTAEETGTVDSGDATTDDVINNIRIRVGEIETALQNLGLLK